MPVVSALMVFHRDTPYLRPAIASLLGQTLRDLELVLVDNGTGLAPAALGELGRDPRLRWVRLPHNAGIAAGHNAGVAAASGEFIALLDYDDLALPRRLERQVAALRAAPRLGLVSSLAERIDAQGVVTGREFALVDPAAQHAYSQYAAPAVMPGYTGRRAVFAQLAYRAEFPLTADFDFLTRAAEHWALAAVPEVLVRYRWHAAQTTQQQAAAIEDGRGVVRLLTARRRAGRPEDLPSLLTGDAAVRSGAEACRRHARRCLAEGFAVLAAYHARRSFVLERRAASLARATALAARALAAAPAGARGPVARMFLTGPVRALGLRPA